MSAPPGLRRLAKSALMATVLSISVLAVPTAPASAVAPNSAATDLVPSESSTQPIGMLFSVSCFSATGCMAVGEANNKSLTELWNGTVWSRVPSLNDNSATATLNGVSCVSSTYCVAVGWSGKTTSTEQPLIEVWNGVAWSLQSAAPQAGFLQGLSGVSCTATTFCLAMGTTSEDAESPSLGLIESWNGVAWSIVGQPALSGDDDSSVLNSVSCSSTDNCMAVGLANECAEVEDSWVCPNPAEILVETWDGTSLSVNTVPNESDGVLSDVSCIATTSDCVATAGGLVDSWNGTSWSVLYPGGAPSGSSSGGALSCDSFTQCMGVGYQAGVESQGVTPESASAASWNGSVWSETPTPDPSTAFDGLNSVSCTSPTNCVAVGEFTNEGPIVFQPLIEIWNGTAWSAVPTPPAFTSSTSTVFRKGKIGTFTMGATGYPMRMHFTKSGSLPSGVTLSSAGVLSGTPATTGTYPLTVTASNGVLPNATQHFTLTVGIVEITTRTLGDPEPGLPYSLQLTEVGGVAPFTWANTTPKLPAGLTLSASGLITGTVKYTVTSGTYSVGISLHDNALPTHHYATATLTIFVE